MIGKPRAKRREKPCLQRFDKAGMKITKNYEGKSHVGAEVDP